jgi:hypothetical protein
VAPVTRIIDIAPSAANRKASTKDARCCRGEGDKPESVLSKTVSSLLGDKPESVLSKTVSSLLGTRQTGHFMVVTVLPEALQ